MNRTRIASSSTRNASRVLSGTVGRRRADWRFLLPAAEQGKFNDFLLLGASYTYRRVLFEVGLAAQISSVCATTEKYDAAAILEGAQWTWQALAASLADGAPVYGELSRSTPFGVRGGLERIRSQLAAHEFALTGIYWVLPDFRNAKRYIPLDFPDAVEWYLDTFYIAGRPIERILEFGLRLFARRHSERLIPFAGSLALTMVKGPGSRTVPAVLETIPQIRGRHARPALVTSGQDESSRVVILPFVDAREPTIAVKLATRSDMSDLTLSEQKKLADLRGSLTAELRESIPAPQSLDHRGRNVVAVTSYARGQSLWVSSGRWRMTQTRAREDLVLAARWLTRFHQSLQLGMTRWDAAARSKWLEARLDEYAAVFSLTPAEEHLWHHTRTHSQALAHQSIPIVWQHNDFGPWNLYRQGNNLTVIDWESAAHGLPLCDLVYLVTYWTFIVQRYHAPAQELNGIAELWIRRPARASHIRFVRKVVAKYLDAVEIDAEFLPVLLVLTWVDRAVDRVHRQRRLGNPASDSRAGNRFVQYVGTLAENSHALFTISENAYK